MKISKALVCTIVIAVIAISAFSAIPVQARTTLLANGQLQILGSSTVYPISSSAKPDFQTYTAGLSAPFTATSVTLNDLGSGYGLNALAGIGGVTLSADVSASSKSGASAGLFTTGTLTDPQEFQIGYDSIAIIVSDQNTWLTQATSAQISDLFRSVGNSAQGGSSAPYYQTWGDWAAAQNPVVNLDASVASQNIVRIGRELSSGTWDGFNTFFMKQFSHEMSYQGTGTFTGQTTSGSGGSQATSNWLPTGTQAQGGYQGLTANQDVLSAMGNSQNKYAIGFIGLGFVQNDLTTHPDHIIPLAIYNSVSSTYVLPADTNVRTGIKNGVVAGAYISSGGSGNAVIQRGLWYFMDGIPASNTADAVKSLWISYVKGNDAYLTSNGYMTMNRADFAGATASNPSTTAGTQSVPDGKVDFNDLLYFSSAWVAYNGPNHTLNPYVDIHADGKVDFNDLLGFSSAWSAYNS
jgi:ABC-type phosphate transport system substrate-binding protein